MREHRLDRNYHTYRGHIFDLDCLGDLETLSLMMYEDQELCDGHDEILEHQKALIDSLKAHHIDRKEK